MEDSSEITLEALLLDAATVLEKQEGLKGLASAVRMALAERGTIPGGETWVQDIMTALNEAASAVSMAHQNETVDLAPLNAALSVVDQWGLTPEQRMGNFLRFTVVKLENLRALVLSQLENREAIEAPVLETLDELLEAFGFPRDGVG